MAKQGKSSSTKKVQRAARAGGGRRSAGPRQGSLLWPAVIGITVVLGLLLIVVSRNEAQDRGEGERPRLFASNPEDHWHMAYGINVCGEYKSPLSQVINSGIHTHGDGLIHQEAQSNAETGTRAVVGKFISDYGSGFRVEDDELRLPGDEQYENGDECGDENGRVAAYLWTSRDDDEPQIITTGIRDIRIRNNQVITFAFVPEGTELEQPPSASNLDDPNAAEGGQPPATPAATTATTAATGGPGTTSEPVPLSTEPPTSAP